MSSQLLDDGYFETTRTELGELLYRLKYRSEPDTIDALAEAAADFIAQQWGHFSLATILPIPPSESRSLQPVPVIARRVGKKMGIPVDERYLMKIKPTPGLKNIEDPAERQRVLIDAFGVRDTAYAGKHILLFDDLYRSGTTFRAATEALIRQGQLTKQNVHVLAVTKTRSKR